MEIGANIYIVVICGQFSKLNLISLSFISATLPNVTLCHPETQAS